MQVTYHQTRLRTAQALDMEPERFTVPAHRTSLAALEDRVSELESTVAALPASWRSSRSASRDRIAVL
jgi:hypothetical protein